MSRDRRLPAWLQRLRPRRNRNAVPTPPADTVPLTSAKYADRANRVDRTQRNDSVNPTSPAARIDSSATPSAPTSSIDFSKVDNRSVWQTLRQRAERDLDTVSSLTTRLTDRAEADHSSNPVDPTVEVARPPVFPKSRSSKTVDPSAWVDRLRPKQLENQLNQQFRQFQARQSSQADPAADDRASLTRQFDRVLSNLPQLLRVDRREIERRFETFARNAKPEDIGKIIKRLPDMNRGPMREIWPKVRSLLEMIRDPSAAWTAKALAIGALVYLISPFDAIPDFIPFAGLIDDAALIVAVVATLARQLDQYMRQSMQASVETAEKLAEIEVQKYNRIVRITLLGSIATALITIGLKLWLDNN
jgi:uncharacterized membrane protein YkvA (DUF1232 family)